MTDNYQYSNFSNDTIKKENSVQAVLECSIDTSLRGGVCAVLCASGDVNHSVSVAGNSQINVSGKLNLKALYTNKDGLPDNIDYISDFSKALTSEYSVEGATVYSSIDVVDVQTVVEGDIIKLQTVIEITPFVVVHNEFNLLTRAENAFVKTAKSRFSVYEGNKEYCTSVSEQYSTGAIVEKVLFFDSKIATCDISKQNGNAVAQGTVCINLIYQSDDIATQKTFSLPFVENIECSEEQLCFAGATVKESRLVIGGGASDNVFDIQADVVISVMTLSSKEQELPVDIFNPSISLIPSLLSKQYTMPCKELSGNQKICGSVELESDDECIDRIVGAIICEDNIVNSVVKDEKLYVEGITCVCVCYKDEAEQYKAINIDLPYSFYINADDTPDDAITVAKAKTCDISVKVKRDREIEVSAFVQVSATVFDTYSICGITCVEEGEEIVPCDDAIEIYFAQIGENLWDIAKKLGVSQESIIAQNGQIDDVLTKAQNIIVYREIAV